MVGVAAGRLVGVVHGDGAALRVGVEEQQRLEVIFDAFADHVLPAGADLQQTRGRSARRRWQPGGGGFWEPAAAATAAAGLGEKGTGSAPTNMFQTLAF